MPDVALFVYLNFCFMKNHIIILIALSIGLWACNPQAKKDAQSVKKQVIKGEAQGTYYAITYYDSLNRDFSRQIDSLLQAFDRSCSNYQPNSIISKVNRNEVVALDSLFIGNYFLADKVSRETGGDFDITVRPLVELWGFGLKNRSNVSGAQVDSIMEFVGYRKVRLDSGRIIKDDPRIMLDYNAIAQGYSVDVVAGFLKKQGIKNFLVDIGGELYAYGHKADGSPWKVGVERPKDGAQYGENLSAIIALQNKGMATSGNYRKFYIKDGVKYAHTIDPHTGYPVQHSLLSATVVAPTAGLADAYATAFMVMGIDRAKVLLKRHPELDVYLIYSDTTGEYRSFSTNGMSEMLEKNSLK
jgi:thiamine biosynthesis lipoprotein